MNTAEALCEVDHRSLDAEQTARLESGELITTVRRAPPGVEVRALVSCATEVVYEMFTRFEELPRHIFGLERAEVLRAGGDGASVRFTLRLPFPVGRICWTNTIRTRRVGDAYTIHWTLLDGDLEINEGQLTIAPHRGRADQCVVRYAVRVQSRSRLPKGAQRLATRWLLPKVVRKLRRAAEGASARAA